MLFYLATLTQRSLIAAIVAMTVSFHMMQDMLLVYHKKDHHDAWRTLQGMVTRHHAAICELQYFNSSWLQCPMAKVSIGFEAISSLNASHKRLRLGLNQHDDIGVGICDGGEY